MRSLSYSRRTRLQPEQCLCAKALERCDTSKLNNYGCKKTSPRERLRVAEIPRVGNYADALSHPWGAHDLPFWEAMGICFIRRRQVNPEVLCSHTNTRRLEYYPRYSRYEADPYGHWLGNQSISPCLGRGSPGRVYIYVIRTVLSV